MSYSQGHISLTSTDNQAIAVANTAQLVTFNQTIGGDKIVATSTSRFTANEAGQYLVNGTAQVTSNVANKIMDIWFKVNGTDVAYTNAKQTIANNEIVAVPIGKLVVTLTAGQYLEVWMSGDSTGLSLVTFAAGVTPTRPVTPSVFLTIVKIHPY